MENLTRRREVLAQATNPGPLRLNPCFGTRNFVGTRNLDQSNTRTRTRACNKREFEHKPRVPAESQIVFSVDERRAALLCRDEQPDPSVTR